jgi:hypothetical protein
MKMSKYVWLCAGLVICIFSIRTAAATPVLSGTEIGVDLGQTTTTNWNNFSTNTTIGAGSVVSLAGAIADGVSVTVNGVNSFSPAGVSNWVGLVSQGGSAPPEFVDSVTSDFAQRTSGGQIFVTISGLPTTLTYNIYAVTLGNPIASQTDVVTIFAASTYGPSSIFRTSSSGGAFHSFLGISPDGTGTFDLRVKDDSQSNPALAGLLIVAVPEPGTITLVAIGCVVAAGLVRRRQSRLATN